MASQGDNSFAAVNGTANLQRQDSGNYQQPNNKGNTVRSFNAENNSAPYANSALARAIGSGFPRPFYGATVRSESLPPAAAPAPAPVPAPAPTSRSPVPGTDYEQSEDEHNVRAQFKPIDSAFGYESSIDYGGSKRLLNFESTDDDALTGEVTDNEEARTRFRATIKDRESKGLAFKLPGLGAITFKSKFCFLFCSSVIFFLFNPI